jgi:hypothetical protein
VEKKKHTKVGILNKIAILTDQHFGARSDSLVFLDYFERFYQDIFFPFLKKNKITEIISLGDMFERRKFCNFLTLKRTRKMWLEPLLENNFKVHCLLGNHDVYYKNTNDVNSIKEILGNYSNFIIYNETEEIMIDDTKVLLVPWINDENRETSLKIINETDAKYCFGHLELNGFLMNRGQKSEVGFDAEPFKKFEMVATGHYHHKSDKENIHYLGSPYEMTFADINDPRGFHIWNTNTKELDFHKNPYKMFYKIFYDDKDQPLSSLLKKITDRYQDTYVKVVVHNRTNPEYFDKFMEHLFSMQPADIKIEEDISIDAPDIIVDMAEDTLTILNKYVDTLEVDIDKDKIKEELRLLHMEAVNMER